MAQGVEVFAVQDLQPEFDPWKPCKYGTKELTSPFPSDLHMHSVTHVHTNLIFLVI